MLANGVSATDGRFLQVLMTTRVNEALDKVAGGGCLGGEENIYGEKSRRGRSCLERFGRRNGWRG